MNTVADLAQTIALRRSWSLLVVLGMGLDRRRRKRRIDLEDKERCQNGTEGVCLYACAGMLARRGAYILDEVLHKDHMVRRKTTDTTEQTI